MIPEAASRCCRAQNRYGAAVRVQTSIAMPRRFSIALLLGSALLFARAQDPANWSIAQKEHFLLTATIESSQYAGKGITDSQKAMLSDGKVEHLAHIQHINLYM